jgi:glycosyltransferase involved in cell wall biosynthesis
MAGESMGERLVGPMENLIHIIEPTLESETGHCHSFLESLCRAGDRNAPSICVWAGRRARLPRLESLGITIRPYFRRRIRRLQEYLLLRRLMRCSGRIFIPTAGRVDLVLLNRAAGGEIPAGKAYLYVHWVRPAARKEKVLRKVAASQPHLVLLAPTASVGEVFSRCGFGRTEIVPYPITPVESASGGVPETFRHILVAGGARPDKGFSAVVDFVSHLAGTGRDLPVVVQASPDHYGRYDTATAADLVRLQSIGYPALRVCRETLDSSEYIEGFRGAICLQPYRREDFADRISGVTLDALSSGCPVVATAGTWMARILHRFDAGLAVGDLSPGSLLAAVEGIRSEYGRFRENAARAGKTLQEENNARHLLSILSGG